MAATKTEKKKRPAVPNPFSGGRRGDISLSFFAYVMILLVVGIVMMSSASYAWAYSEHGGDGLYYAKNQAKNAVIGFVAMIFFMKMDYHNFKNLKLPVLKKLNIAGLLYIIGGILLIAVLLIGNDEGGSMGARRWIDIGPLNLQPSEVAKLALIIFFAYSMERDGQKMNTFTTGIIKYAVILGVYVLLIALEKHISGIILIGTIAVAMILCGGVNKKHFLALGAGALGFAIAYISWQAQVPGSYVAVRIKSWQNPFADKLGDTWQTANSLIAIGSGGLFGLGLGNSRQKYLYLPETKNDFVFPIVCEELGFVGALAIIIVFFLLIVEGYSIAVRCKDRFGMLIAVGITTQIGIQTVLNLAVVSNLIPNTGISLPFFSYGGTALIMQLAEMGIMLNISQHRYYPDEKPKEKKKKKQREKEQIAEPKGA
ncbi:MULTISPECIES: FtsW/RodA/SpoVE family cell cycle protein [Ruminococcus]|uniref:Probable peptidoglycan glycosyltransferase FtsW n=1 Tax=Ruminococcus flavefaciens TaxID=1265 RepID=A0A315XZ89_RUMFL|nr:MULTISPECIES: FtsW/RodA/SpoVE family cell cycle protein [Ruminococcus]MBQ6252262.1 FtsW/RodA/SpoVE family cell cycle protein [Ruminococcus sp.]MBR3667009.1 FtsW/RodA/SpoVE family cell cycle protein [Ruminococcus sp.]MBR6995591.1 FtsW/RodA/SpoVE family cell cycle protein [Ruminococcus sp.]PWJ13063.1 cell division protein FtsW [Ruminococcus flavefaciens]SSA48655.1 cell division protein FtsW [Ruminococcus flavefaciens]